MKQKATLALSVVETLGFFSDLPAQFTKKRKADLSVIRREIDFIF
jgi:hypothetical protein